MEEELDALVWFVMFYFFLELAPSYCQECSLSLASRVEHFQKLCHRLERQIGYYKLNMHRKEQYTQWVFLHSLACPGNCGT